MAGLSLDSAARPADFAALESALYGSKIPHFAFRIPHSELVRAEMSGKTRHHQVL